MSTSKLALADAKSTWRTHAMLRAMAGDYLLREQFATDPVQVYCDYTLSEGARPADTEAANQVVFCAVSNPALRQWMGRTAQRLHGRVPSRHLFAKEFAEAVASSRDGLLVLSLMRGAAADGAQFTLLADFLRTLLSVMGRDRVATGTEMSPEATATEMSPGATGTEMSPGAMGLVARIRAELGQAVRLAVELRRIASSGGTEMSPGSTGTEMSPGALQLGPSLVAAVRRVERLGELLLRAGNGTEMSPGTATEMSPGASRLFEQLVAEVKIGARLATRLLQGSGTEMSPGATGTEMSPGATGTEMSPGRLGSLDTLVVALRRAELFSVEYLRLAEGTEMSPGTATEMSPGVTATEMSPGARWTDIAQRLRADLGRAVQLSIDLSRVQQGTEMSPGATATEMSPGGTGTEMSPGAHATAEWLVAAVLRAQRQVQLLLRARDETDMTPGATSTEMSPGITATEMSPGLLLPERLLTEINAAARIANALWKFSGTEMSPASGTEMSPGATGTEMSPGTFDLMQQLSKALRHSQSTLDRLLRASGTEMSPGGGTEMSPGGTEMSPGHAAGAWGVRLNAQVAVALGALVAYATSLRQHGALDTSGLELG